MKPGVLSRPADLLLWLGLVLVVGPWWVGFWALGRWVGAW